MKSFYCGLVLILILVITHQSNAQQENKLRVHSVSIGIGYFNHLSSNFDDGVSFIDEPPKKANLNINGDLAFVLDDYIFSFYFASSLVELIPYKQSGYSQFNLSIGKEFLTKDWFALEGHLGIGYFESREQFEPNGPIQSYGTLGFPLRIEANFDLSKHFAMGFKS